MATFDVITNEDGVLSVQLPADVRSIEDTSPLLRPALCAAWRFLEGSDPDEFTLERLVAGDHQVVLLSAHTSRQSIEEAGCGCEDENWWCPEGDGLEMPWLVVEDIYGDLR